jgi:hypothetical protein
MTWHDGVHDNRNESERREAWRFKTGNPRPDFTT